MKGEHISTLWAAVYQDVRGRSRLGADSDTLQSWVDAAGTAWNVAVESAKNSVLWGPRMARDFMVESGSTLYGAALAAYSAGARTAGNAFSEMADRVAQAVAGLGQGAGGALAGLLGGNPFHFALLGAGVLLLVAAGVLLTPGGQILIAKLPMLRLA